MQNIQLDGHWLVKINFCTIYKNILQNKNQYGGSFMYHLEDNGQSLVSIGFIVALDVSPFINEIKLLIFKNLVSKSIFESIQGNLRKFLFY